MTVYYRKHREVVDLPSRTNYLKFCAIVDNAKTKINWFCSLKMNFMYDR